MSIRFACVAVIVHLIFLYAVFDVYFTSPLVHGMPEYSARLTGLPPAKRLVLFVADGLRADKCFELDDFSQPRTPFLRKVIEERGAWGVSHTRVPTESRPGHVALIAGFYEDVSAVAKGWKDNPVQFDSVFNKSRHTWSWGSPDILPMFSKGIADGHVSTHTYSADIEDFAGKELHQLDTWVFNEFESFINKARNNATLLAALQHDKIIFFLHLLGIDTNGHAHKPQSKEYLENIRLMDGGIRKISLLLDDFYRDERTAYIMTSDHGMTGWGSHGTGHPEETMTPLVLWGAGVRGPMVEKQRQRASIDAATCNHDGVCLASAAVNVDKWNLSSTRRHDVDQADVAPLMAALLGLPFPTNSVGTLRTGLLNMSDHDKAQSIFANALQVAAQFKIKEQQTELRTLSPLFRPYLMTRHQASTRLQAVSAALSRGDYDQSERLATDLISEALRGLAYYHAYDRTFLGACLVLGFIGWMAYTVVAVLEPATVRGSSTPSQLSYRSACFLISRVVIVMLLAVQNSPWSYYLYSLGPTWLWEEVLKRSHDISRAMRHSKSVQHVWVGLLTLAFLCFGLELLVYSFFYRELLSFGLICICTMPWWSMITSHNRASWPRAALLFSWCGSSLALAVFPLLPVVGRNTHYNIVLCAALCSSIAIYYGAAVVSETILKVQSAIILMTGLVVKWTSLSVEARDGVPLLSQYYCWTLLGSTFCIPLASSTNPSVRIMSLGAAFIALYLTFSISHESLFILVFSLFLFSWYHVEKSLCIEEPGLMQGSHRRSVTRADVRLAFLFIFVITVGFFGTGNIASLNSFEPASVYCYLTVFNPFLMGGLMLLKVTLPFLLVSCAFSVIQSGRSCSSPGSPSTERVFLIILLMSDFMGLNFFFLIKNEGSWLDIGTSISHYVIALSTTIMLLLFYEIARTMTKASLPVMWKWLQRIVSFKVHSTD